jgi:arylsulfatase A-like enzyme
MIPVLVLAAAAAQSAPRPNLLFIMTDQQRFDALSIAGNEILQTPNMDRIGKEGVYFANAYSQCPVCGPARSSLMTGRTVEHSKVFTNMDADIDDRTPMPCYDELLIQWLEKTDSPHLEEVRKRNAI